ncbi:MAG: HPP family protein [Thiobacillus sp.]
MMRKLAYSVSEREHWISAVGGLLGILAVGWCSYFLLGKNSGAILIISSMGSSAVLLFAAPHSAMSQPWPLVGGHLVSALIGVVCAHWLANDLTLAAAMAVALSIAAMYSLRCLHAPGGATAVAAVLGGETVNALGWEFVLTPVMLNVVVILTVAVLFNYPFEWRRYPQCWYRLSQNPADPVEKSMIPHSSLVYALSQIDTFVDVSEEDLQRIYALAMKGAHVPETSEATVTV